MPGVFRRRRPGMAERLVRERGERGPCGGGPWAARGTGRGGAVRPGAAEEDEGESAARGTWLCEPSACPGETRCSRGGNA